MFEYRYNLQMKHLIPLLAIYCLSVTPALADSMEYDFELIIFEDTSGRYANSEQWEHELVDTGASRDTIQHTAETSLNNTIIDVNEIESIGLDTYAKKLNSNRRYNILLHKAWRQTGLADDDAMDIPIDSRQDRNSGQISSETGKRSQPGDNTNNIHGSIRIVLGRYLHIYTDMIYQRPHEAAVPVMYNQGSKQFREYPIKFHRRMRSKELHYLDHPMVGILVMAMPVKKQQETKEET